VEWTGGDLNGTLPAYRASRKKDRSDVRRAAYGVFTPNGVRRCPSNIPTMKRRAFLENVASTSLLAALPAINLTDAERSAVGRPVSDDWDLSWVGRLRGKSRAVFDSPEVSEGGALFRASVWRNQHNKVLGTPVAELTPIVVFRHMAIPLVMNDAHWDHLGVGKDLQLKDPATGKWTKKNPLASAAPDAPPEFKEITIPAFIASGGIVLACHLAFGDIVAQYKEKDKLSEADAEKVAKQHLLPGVILQPSGFFAVLKAQDEGCKYMLGS